MDEQFSRLEIKLVQRILYLIEIYFLSSWKKGLASCHLKKLTSDIDKYNAVLLFSFETEFNPIYCIIPFLMLQSNLYFHE